MGQMSQAEIIRDNDASRRILHTMLAAFGTLAFVYIFILGSMVLNIIERKALEREAAALSNEVGGMELVYLSLSSKVNLELSYSMGFKEAKPVFATRRSLGFNTSNLAAKSENEI